MNDQPKIVHIPHLLPHQLVLAEQARNIWHINLDCPMVPDDFLRAEAYAHVAKQLHKGDQIHVLAEDGDWYAEFVVRSIDGSNVQIGEIRFIEFELRGLNADDFEIEWAGQREKARVLRKSDRRIMVSGLPSKEAAAEWLFARADRSPKPQEREAA